MPVSQSNKRITLNIAKTLLALVLLAVLAGVAASQLAPKVPLQTVLLYCVIGASIVLIAAVLMASVMQMFNQFILRHGGTDASWFWFKAEPPGLVSQREQLKAQNE